MSWKQYGGVRKVEQFQNLSIGTLVADQVLLREKYSGSLVFGGSIVAKGDAVTAGSMISTQNIYSNFDVNVGRNMYLNKKLFFGYPNVLSTQILNLDSYKSPTLSSTEPTFYAYLSGTTTGIGINTVNPTSVLEITGTTNNILTVSSLTSTNRSIISQNNVNNGVVVTATNGLSYIDFFNSATTSTINTPDTRLQSSTNTFTATSSTIILSASTQNTLTSPTTNIISSATTNITSSFNTNIYSGKNTDILSKLRVANRFSNNSTALDATGTFYNETAEIYDISNGSYLYDAYENPAQTGNALTLIATDNSSNTFLNWVTPNKNGFAVGGGTFVNDTTRNMGTLGLLDVCGNYTPAQTIVSGKNKYKLQSTVGINTYSPRVDRYSLDINGPVHLTYGEINKVVGTTFEIQQMSFSKNATLKTTGIAVGTASSINLASTTNPYMQYITYTSNGGKSWSFSRVSTVTNLELFTGNNFCVYTYDNNFAILGTVRSLLFFTVNGGQTWTNFTLSDTIVRTVVNVFIANTGVSSQRVFISFSNNQTQYFDTNYSTLSTSNPTITLSSAISLPSSNVFMDGYGNTVYFVNSSGIQSYTVTPFALKYTNASYSYNHIQAYDASNVIAVGQNIISYTTDGTNWNTITSISGTGSFTLNQVSIYDLNNAVAVGSNGVFAYSTNWTSGIWSIVPNEILNASGISGRINGPTNTLRHIFIYDSNTIIISRLITTFSISTSILGSSNIYYCVLPNLFNQSNNNVFDVCGNMTIAGDINVVDSGAIKTTNSTFYLGNQSTLQQLYVGSNTTKTIFTGDVSLNSRMYVGSMITGSGGITVSAGTTSLQATTIAGDTSLNSRLFVNGDVSLNGNLSMVTQPTNTSNSLGATTKFVQNQITYLQNNPSLVNPLITQNVNLQTANSTIFGNGNINLTPSGNNVVHITSGLVVDGSINFMGEVFVTNTTLTVVEELDISINTPFGPAIKASQSGSGDIANFMQGNLPMATVNQNGLSIGAGVKPPRYTLDVSGLAVLSSYLGIGVTNINKSYSLDISGSVNSSGNITTSGYLTVGSNLTTTGNITAGSNLTTTGNITTTGYLTTTGNITAGSNLTTTGNITTNGGCIFQF